jgi:hypothetical protein
VKSRDDTRCGVHHRIPLAQSTAASRWPKTVDQCGACELKMTNSRAILPSSISK